MFVVLLEGLGREGTFALHGPKVAVHDGPLHVMALGGQSMNGGSSPSAGARPGLAAAPGFVDDDDANDGNGCCCL
jgi:hypothetical protein